MISKTRAGIAVIAARRALDLMFRKALGKAESLYDGRDANKRAS
jgi:hypothetical protein